MARKLKVGFFSFTGDEGCMITLLELLSDRLEETMGKLDILYWRVLTPADWKGKEYDVAVIEGAVSVQQEVDKLKAVREHSKRVLAVGTCACDGSPSNHRNSFDERRLGEIAPVLKRFKYLDKVRPIGDFIKVDDKVAGCPVLEEPFLKVLGKYFKEFGVE